MLSRREFIRRSMLYALALAGGSAISSCSPNPTATPVPATATPVPPTLTPTNIPVSPTATSVASAISSSASSVASTATRAASVSSSASSVAKIATATPTMIATPVPPVSGEAYLAVARGTSPAAITRAVVDALGGIKKFVKPGNEVIIKPNICNAQNTFEYASTTNPEVVAELVKMCLEAGAKRVRVMDQPFSGTAANAYKQSGIKDAVEQVGGVMEVMASAKYTNFDFPKTSRDLRSLKVYQDIMKADVVINVPIAKHHGSAQLTMSMKGLMGVIQDRNAIHTALDQRIADLSTVMKPTLNIIDAVRVLTKNGPTGGSLSYVQMANTMIASADPVAADGYAAQLLFKKKPQDIGYIKYGAEMGLGTYDFAKLAIKEVSA